MDQIYNPFNQSVKANQYGTLPMSSIRPSPEKKDFMPYGPLPNNGGRLQPVDKRQVVSDPIDIDDDVSDHGPESLEHQLQELDGMNKYLNGIKIPTSKDLSFKFQGLLTMISCINMVEMEKKPILLVG